MPTPNRAGHLEDTHTVHESADGVIIAQASYQFRNTCRQSDLEELHGACLEVTSSSREMLTMLPGAVHGVIGVIHLVINLGERGAVHRIPYTPLWALFSGFPMSSILT